MAYGCLYCARSYQKTLSSLTVQDQIPLLYSFLSFVSYGADESIGWAVDIIDTKELSAKMLKKQILMKFHDSAIGLVNRVLNMGFLLTEVYLDIVGDAEKYRMSERFPGIKFVVAKADSLYPVVSGASIVAKITNTWVFGFPSLVRFSWCTCTPYFKDIVEVLWESDEMEDGSRSTHGKRQLKLSNVDFTTSRRKSKEIESSGKGRCKFFQAC
ncbi:hypothetical protein CIPAW_14G033400 [Carya illinoinensis]|uniref:Ribonuclease n=1 Tax=Carya illinoinensis TaxID=32201 RepID=A0A8T1NAK8_CARIL|nr:hypothetical protein CIPAW_14G033400 [Carya illinoinensis]